MKDGALRLTAVVPTRDRAEKLRLCLAALSDQLEPRSDRIVVADDGSVDSTAEVISQFPLAVRVISEGCGASVARNAALRTVSSELVLFIDDDIVCSPGLIARHLAFHRANPMEEDALIGLVTWDPSKPITAHMRWLEDSGPLFAFNEIADHDDVDFAHFCTANASLKRSLLGRVAGPFDETLRRFTDVEIGGRLKDAGMRLHYDQQAVAWHLRQDDPASTDRRMYEVGRASVHLDEVRPGLAPAAAEPTLPRRLRRTAARLLSPLAPLLPPSVAGRIWSSRAAWAYARGRAEAGTRRQ